MTPEDEKKYGISPFDDELQINDKIAAWQRGEIERLTSERDLYLEVLLRVKRIDTGTCVRVTQILHEVQSSV